MDPQFLQMLLGSLGGGPSQSNPLQQILQMLQSRPGMAQPFTAGGMNFGPSASNRYPTPNSGGSPFAPNFQQQRQPMVTAQPGVYNPYITETSAFDHITGQNYQVEPGWALQRDDKGMPFLVNKQTSEIKPVATKPNPDPNNRYPVPDLPLFQGNLQQLSQLNSFSANPAQQQQQNQSSGPGFNSGPSTNQPRGQQQLSIVPAPPNLSYSDQSSTTSGTGNPTSVTIPGRGMAFNEPFDPNWPGSWLPASEGGLPPDWIGGLDPQWWMYPGMFGGGGDGGGGGSNNAVPPTTPPINPDAPGGVQDQPNPQTIPGMPGIFTGVGRAISRGQGRGNVPPPGTTPPFNPNAGGGGPGQPNAETGLPPGVPGQWNYPHPSMNLLFGDQGSNSPEQFAKSLNFLGDVGAQGGVRLLNALEPNIAGQLGLFGTSAFMPNNIDSYLAGLNNIITPPNQGGLQSQLLGLQNQLMGGSPQLAMGSRLAVQNQASQNPAYQAFANQVNPNLASQNQARDLNMANLGYLGSQGMPGQSQFLDQISQQLGIGNQAQALNMANIGHLAQAGVPGQQQFLNQIQQQLGIGGQAQNLSMQNLGHLAQAGMPNQQQILNRTGQQFGVGDQAQNLSMQNLGHLAQAGLPSQQDFLGGVSGQLGQQNRLTNPLLLGLESNLWNGLPGQKQLADQFLPGQMQFGNQQQTAGAGLTNAIAGGGVPGTQNMAQSMNRLFNPQQLQGPQNVNAPQTQGVAGAQNPQFFQDLIGRAFGAGQGLQTPTTQAAQLGAAPTVTAPKAQTPSSFAQLQQFGNYQAPQMQAAQFQGPQAVGTPGLQKPLEQTLRTQLTTGGLTPQFVQSQRETVLEPQMEQLLGRINQMGGGNASLGSGLSAELQRRQERDFNNQMTGLGFQGQQNALSQGQALAGQQFGQGQQNQQLLQQAAQQQAQLQQQAGSQNLQAALQGSGLGLQATGQLAGLQSQLAQFNPQLNLQAQLANQNMAGQFGQQQGQFQQQANLANQQAQQATQQLGVGASMQGLGFLPGLAQTDINRQLQNQQMGQQNQQFNAGNTLQALLANQQAQQRFGEFQPQFGLQSQGLGAQFQNQLAGQGLQAAQLQGQQGQQGLQNFLQGFQALPQAASTQQQLAMQLAGQFGSEARANQGQITNQAFDLNRLLQNQQQMANQQALQGQGQITGQAFDLNRLLQNQQQLANQQALAGQGQVTNQVFDLNRLLQNQQQLSNQQALGSQGQIVNQALDVNRLLQNQQQLGGQQALAFQQQPFNQQQQTAQLLGQLGGQDFGQMMNLLNNMTGREQYMGNFVQRNVGMGADYTQNYMNSILGLIGAGLNPAYNQASQNAQGMGQFMAMLGQFLGGGG